MLAHDPGVRLGEDPEELHQLRVATRRLRSVLRTATPLLEATWAQALRDELSWLGDELGLAARRRRAHRAPPRGGCRARSGRPSRAEAALRRARRRGQEREESRARDLAQRALLRVAGYGRGRCSRTAGRRRQRLASKGGSQGVPTAWPRRWTRSPPSTSDEAVHRARIKGKRARYAAELLEDDLGSAGKRLISAAKRFQDVAGEHQDAVVAEERIRKLLRGKRAQRTALAAGILIAGERERRARTAAALPDAWNNLDKAAAKAWS